jgi:hypothetical protein
MHVTCAATQPTLSVPVDVVTNSHGAVLGPGGVQYREQNCFQSRHANEAYYV